MHKRDEEVLKLQWVEQHAAYDHLFIPAGECWLVCKLGSLTPVRDRTISEPELEDGTESLDVGIETILSGKIGQPGGQPEAQCPLALVEAGLETARRTRPA